MRQLDQDAASVAEQLQLEEARFRAAKESVQATTEAFAKFMAEPPTKASRERLMLALRDAVKVMRLSVDKQKGRMVEVELRQEGQAPERWPFDLLVEWDGAAAKRKLMEKFEIPSPRPRQRK